MRQTPPGEAIPKYFAAALRAAGSAVRAMIVAPTPKVLTRTGKRCAADMFLFLGVTDSALAAISKVLLNLLLPHRHVG